MILECNVVLENSEKSETLGMEILLTVPGGIDLSEIRHYRQSVDNDGNAEDYTIVYTASNMSFCIDMPVEEFRYNLNKYRDSQNTKKDNAQV